MKVEALPMVDDSYTNDLQNHDFSLLEFATVKSSNSSLSSNKQSQESDNSEVFIEKGFDLAPGYGIGNLTLGSNLNRVVRILRDDFNVERRQILCCFSGSSPVSRTAMILVARSCGLKLWFHPLSQKLFLIELSKFCMFDLNYDGKPLLGMKLITQNRSATNLSTLYEAFGPTYPGTIAQKNKLQQYLLHYSGLSLAFSNSGKNKFQDSSSLVPFKFPDGSQPELASLYIYSVHTDYKLDLESSKINIGSKSENDISLSAAFKDSKFHFEVKIDGRHVLFCKDDTLQCILRKLGQPNQQSYKTDHKLNIHSVSSSIDSEADFQEEMSINGHATGNSTGLSELSNGCLQTLDFFLNYFDLGFDLLICHETNRVKKIIFHNNLPSDHLFLLYERCKFKVVCEDNTTFSYFSKFPDIKNDLALQPLPIVKENQEAKQTLVFSSRKPHNRFLVEVCEDSLCSVVFF